MEFKSGSNDMLITGQDGKEFNHTSVYDKKLHSDLQKAKITVSGSSVTAPTPSSVEAEAGPSQPIALDGFKSRMSILASAPPSLSSSAPPLITYNMDVKCRSGDRNRELHIIASRCSAPAQRASGPPTSTGPRIRQ